MKNMKGMKFLEGKEISVALFATFLRFVVTLFSRDGIYCGRWRFFHLSGPGVFRTFDTPARETYSAARLSQKMPAALPYSKHSPGRTFVIAISVLGLVALTQVGLLGWALVKRVQAGPQVVAAPAATAPDAKGSTGTGDEKEKETLAVNDPFEDGKEPLTTDDSTEPIMPPAKPQPVPMVPRLGLAPDNRMTEMFQQGRTLRERGDTSNALLRFREAYASDPKNPEAIYEIAVTLEKMGLPDKANENWKRIFDMGETAGVYFAAAEAKMKAAVMTTRVGLNQPPAGESNVQTEGGNAQAATFGLGLPESEEMHDAKSLRHFVLRVPVQLRLKTKISVKDLTIQVIFYDMLDNKPVRTNANVKTTFTTLPFDFAGDENEVVTVDYVQPVPESHDPKEEIRKYYGYIVRVYYKDELQATRSEPSALGQRFPASQTLEKDPSQ